MGIDEDHSLEYPKYSEQCALEQACVRLSGHA